MVKRLNLKISDIQVIKIKFLYIFFFFRKCDYKYSKLLATNDIKDNVSLQQRPAHNYNGFFC